MKCKEGAAVNDYFDFLLRLMAALGAGLLVGYTREKLNRPAGLRTHSLISLGAALITILSIYYFGKDGGDPGRVAAQIVSGMGFLGAGTIIKTGFSVKGLTTAATLWVTAALGMSFGAGEYLLGTTVTILVIIVVVALRQAEEYMGKKSIKKCIIISDDSSDFIKELNKWIESLKISINMMEFDREEGQLKTIIIFKTHEDYIKAQTNVQKISKHEDFKGIDFL